MENIECPPSQYKKTMTDVAIAVRAAAPRDRVEEELSTDTLSLRERTYQVCLCATTSMQRGVMKGVFCTWVPTFSAKGTWM